MCATCEALLVDGVQVEQFVGCSLTVDRIDRGTPIFRDAMGCEFTLVCHPIYEDWAWLPHTDDAQASSPAVVSEEAT